MCNLVNKLFVKAIIAKEKVLESLRDESGEANIIAIILVLAIVIALAIIFRSQIMALFNRIWGSLSSNVSNVL